MSKWRVWKPDYYLDSETCCIIDSKSQEHLLCALEQPFARQIVREHNCHERLLEMAKLWVRYLKNQDKMQGHDTEYPELDEFFAEAGGKQS